MLDSARGDKSWFNLVLAEVEGLDPFRNFCNKKLLAILMVS